MKVNILLRSLLPLLVAMAVAPAISGPSDIDGAHDLGALLELAGERLDLESQDAILLVDELRETWTGDGRRVRAVHQVVYVRTSLGVRHYADLRVPYDGERQRLTVSTLRTWRLSDERWIDSGPTAKVETLPFALDHAPDYAAHREMMLLHDGVELPCILETAYSIEDMEPYRRGTDGTWTASRPDPAVLSRLVLTYPADSPMVYRTVLGMEDPEKRRDENQGVETLTFSAGPVSAVPGPLTEETRFRVSHVIWSTWPTWVALARELEASFAQDQELGAALRESLADRLKSARTVGEKAKRVAELVAETTRGVRYDRGWWPGPRGADRTWSTAYGNALDRAALAAALYREAGIEAKLAFRGRGFGMVERTVPSLTWAAEAGLWVENEGMPGWFDAEGASFSTGTERWLWGRAVWRPAVDEIPRLLVGNRETFSSEAVQVDLSLDEKKENWTGRGVFSANGALSPYDSMAGLEDEAMRHLRQVVGSVLEGAEIEACNPEIFLPNSVTYGFELSIPLAEPDDLGRIRLEAGGTPGWSGLLADQAIGLHETKRESRVELPSALSRRVEIRIETEGLDTVYLPAEQTIANDAGRFAVTVESSDDFTSLTREISLARFSYGPEEWSDLRSLLIADEHDANRLFLLEKAESAESAARVGEVE